MSNYQITAVNGKREFESKYGPLVSYKINIKGDDGYEGEAEITRKPESPAPSQGETIEGTLDRSNPRFPPKLKKAPGGGAGAPRGARSAKDSDSIERQVAYKGAVEMAVAFAKDADEGKALLPDLFELSVGLIQGKANDPVETVKQVFPGAKEETQPITRKEVIKAYQQWFNVQTASGKSDEQITNLFETKKTALGIGDLDEASEESKAGLMAFLTDGI
jgi:hypothetical protein